MIVAGFNERRFYNRSYRIGFPGGGQWREVFNSDVYDQWVNSNVQWNGAGIFADRPACGGLPTSAAITLPANSHLAFARDSGDFSSPAGAPRRVGEVARWRLTVRVFGASRPPHTA